MQAPTKPRAAASPLLELLSSCAHGEGCSHSAHPGIHFYRVTRPTRFKKTTTFGSTLTVAAQGKKEVWFGADRLTYDPSRYLVVTEEASYEGEILEASPEKPYFAVCIELPPDVIVKTMLALQETELDARAPRPVPPMPAFVAGLDEVLEAAVLRLLRATRDPVEQRILAPLALEEVVFRLLRSEAAQLIQRSVGRPSDVDGVREAIRFMRANAARPLSVEDLAKRASMSPSHFAHRFREIARVSPMRFLKQLRLNEARALLVNQGLRVSEVAARAGYESASHFNRDFKAYFGASPSDYLKRLQAARSQDQAS
ncbi:MAG: AraC family transcriptional regulator [Myxococcota bacterium]